VEREEQAQKLKVMLNEFCLGGCNYKCDDCILSGNYDDMGNDLCDNISETYRDILRECE